jgi:DNA primase
LHSHTSEDYGELLKNAPLWLDWQIQQIIQDRDLKQATDFQQVSKQLVKLLKNINNIDTRDYYIDKCAEILSFGDDILKPLRVENLLTQIAPVATSRKPMSLRKKQPINVNQINAPAGGSLLELAEALLLKIYLHCPEQRQAIIDKLEGQNLEFSLSHHRFLWQQILEFKVGQINLISNLQDRYLELAEELELVSHLFHLNEKSKKEILRTSHVVQAAIACMELVMSQKRYRHLEEQWKQSDEKAEPERYEYYGKAFPAEKQRYLELNEQRNFSIEEVQRFSD